MYGTATQSLSVSEPNGPLDLDPISSSSGPCILYTEIPYLSRFLRIVGHIAVTNSDRTKIYELRAWPLLGTNNSVWVLEGRGDVVSPILFGRPRKMLPVALPPGADAAWDDALEEEAVRWRTRRHLGIGSNCHSFVSDVLNNLHRRLGGVGEPHSFLSLVLAVHRQGVLLRPETGRWTWLWRDPRKLWMSFIETAIGLRRVVQPECRRQINRLHSQSVVPLVGSLAMPLAEAVYGDLASPCERQQRRRYEGEWAAFLAGESGQRTHDADAQQLEPPAGLLPAPTHTPSRSQPPAHSHSHSLSASAPVRAPAAVPLSVSAPPDRVPLGLRPAPAPTEVYLCQAAPPRPRSAAEVLSTPTHAGAGARDTRRVASSHELPPLSAPTRPHAKLHSDQHPGDQHGDGVDVLTPLPPGPGLRALRPNRAASGACPRPAPAPADPSSRGQQPQSCPHALSGRTGFRAIRQDQAPAPHAQPLAQDISPASPAPPTPVSAAPGLGASTPPSSLPPAPAALVPWSPNAYYRHARQRFVASAPLTPPSYRRLLSAAADRAYRDAVRAGAGTVLAVAGRVHDVYHGLVWAPLAGAVAAVTNTATAAARWTLGALARYAEDAPGEGTRGS